MLGECGGGVGGRSVEEDKLELRKERLGAAGGDGRRRTEGGEDFFCCMIVSKRMCGRMDSEGPRGGNEDEKSMYVDNIPGESLCHGGVTVLY